MSAGLEHTAEVYGYWGISIMVGVFQPIPPDVFIVGGRGLGLDPYIAALVALFGTLMGGSTCSGQVVQDKGRGCSKGTGSGGWP